MITSVIHAGGKGTRLREAFEGPKAMAPIGEYPLIWYHLRPLLASKKISKYVFTLMNEPEPIKKYLNKLMREEDYSYIKEPHPLGRAGSVRLGIENNEIDPDLPLLMSHPDDIIPINIENLIEYGEKISEKGKSLILVMAKKTTSPYGIGVTSGKTDVLELEYFMEKPELPLIANHYANTGMALYLPEALEWFKKAPLDQKTHPEDLIIPNLVKKGKVAIYPIERWISVNYASDYEYVKKIGKNGLIKFVDVANKMLSQE